ncbi:hypothetical protein JXA85_05905, partial [Candidatus Woesearchaeota archaeon]|nr:hypothetical protein [Candidatus Woesearchaeota archaeon]
MIKKSVILLFGLLFVTHSALGATSIFDKWVYENEDIVIDGVTFKVTYVGANGINPPSSVYLVSDSTRTILELEECHEENNVFTCFIGTEEGDKVVEGELRTYKSHITAEKSGPSITVSRTIEPSSVVIGDVFLVTTTIENRGDLEAEKLVFKDYFPSESFRFISDFKGCYYDNSSMMWKGDLGVSTSVVCKYQVRGLKIIEYPSVATADFLDNGVAKKVTSTATFTVKKDEVFFKLVINKTNVSVGEKVNAVFSITNNYATAARIHEFKVTVPDGLMIRSDDRYLRRSGNFFIWDGTINEQSSKNFSAEIEAYRPGLFLIKESMTYKVDATDRISEDEQAINSTFSELIMKTNLQSSYAANENTRLVVDILNPGLVQYENILLSVESDIEELREEKTIPLIEAEKTFNAVIKEFTVPASGNKTEHYVDIGIRYSSKWGSSLSSELHKKFTVSGEVKSSTATKTAVTSSTGTENNASIIVDSSKEPSPEAITLTVSN